MSLTFYSHPLSPFGNRPAVILQLLGLKYNMEEVHPFNQPEWYSKDINPLRKIPALKLADGTVIIESDVICWYLAEEYGKDKALLLETPLKNAQAKLFVQQWNRIITAAFDALRSTRSTDKADAQAKNDALNDAILKVDQTLTKCSPEGPFLFGEQPTLPDYIGATFAIRLVAVESLLTRELPGLKAERYQQWFQAVSKLRCLKETVPSLNDDVKFFTMFSQPK